MKLNLPIKVEALVKSQEISKAELKADLNVHNRISRLGSYRERLRKE